MRFNQSQVGGKELDSVHWDFKGPNARELMGRGRALLGNLKMRMQLGGILFLSAIKELPDGSVIKATSNRNGLVDIDNVSILRRGGGKKYRVVGYIIQGFANGDENNRIEQYLDYKVVLPDGKHLGYEDESVVSSGYPPAYWTVSSPIFPDNNARYLPRTIDGEVSEFQEVFTSTVTYSNVFNGTGPALLSIGFIQGQPPLASCYDYVFPGTAPLFPDQNRTAYDGTNYNFPATWIPDFSYHGGACPNHWSETGLTEEQWDSQHIGWAYSLSAPIEIEPYNAYMTAQYNYVMQNGLVNDTDIDYRFIKSHGRNEFVPLVENHLYRRNDDQGLITQTGFKINNGFDLTSRGEGHGDGILFMTPIGDKKKFRFTAEIISENSKDDHTLIDHHRVGVDTTLDIGQDNYYLLDPVDVNVVQDYNELWTTSVDFGVPIKVQQGIHKITVKRTILDSSMESTITIWLLIENEGYRKVNVKNINFITGKYESTTLLKINLSEIEDVSNCAAAVTTELYTPIN